MPNLIQHIACFFTREAGTNKKGILTAGRLLLKNEMGQRGWRCRWPEFSHRFRTHKSAQFAKNELTTPVHNCTDHITDHFVLRNLHRNDAPHKWSDFKQWSNFSAHVLVYRNGATEWNQKDCRRCTAFSIRSDEILCAFEFQLHPTLFPLYFRWMEGSAH